MIRRIGGCLATLAFVAAGHANAHEATQGPGTLEVTIIPGGGMFFTDGTNSPSFGNYQIGAAPAYNFNRIVGVEGEIGGSIGISDQSVLVTGPVNCPLLRVGTSSCSLSGKAPNMLNYSGNLIVNAAAGHSIVPYATGGIGGMTMFQRASLGVRSTQTISDRQRRRWRQVVRAEWTLGTSRRLPVHRGPFGGQRAAVLRSGEPVRSSDLRRSGHQRPAVTWLPVSATSSDG